MSETSKMLNAATIVPVRNVAATLQFYEDVLGFERRLLTDDGGFGIAERGGAAVEFIATEDAEALKATATNIALTIRVRDLDALYSELKPKLETLPKGRVRPPFDQPYGVREFHVKDPDGCLLFFAERD